MEIFKKHKRILYRPGMISLVFIPLLCLCYFYKNDPFTEYKALQISMSDDKIFKEYNVPTLRKYKELDFNNSEVFEHSKLDNLQVSLRELKKKNDTINGIKIYLGKKTHYSVFVRVLDILIIEDIPTYFIYKDDIWVLVPPARKPSKQNIEIRRMICVSGRMSREDELRMEEKIKQKEFQLKVSLFKQNWMLFLGYFGIVLLNIFALIKFNKRFTNLISK